MVATLGFGYLHALLDAHISEPPSLRHLSQAHQLLMIGQLLAGMKDKLPKMLFILFLTEGLAVGVGFGAIGKTASATFENARYLVYHVVKLD